MSVEYRDYYAALGLKRTATAAEIKKAFRRLAQEFHPDRVGDDEKAAARFREVNEAYEVLGERERRREYDQLGADLRAGQRLEGDLAKRASAAMATRRAAVKAAAGAYRKKPGAASGGGLLGKVRSLFGVGGAKPKKPPLAKGDREQTLKVTFAQALAGEKVKVDVGGGKSLSMQLPVDLKPGRRVRLKGQGGCRPDGTPGDLHLVVEFAADPDYRFDGEVLVRKHTITAAQAAEGATLVVDVNGRSLKVKVPAGTKSKARMRLRGQGLPAAGEVRGDLMLELIVKG